MIFNTLDFILFLPVVVLLHYLLPHKFRNLLLLVASYFFYASYNLGLTRFLVFCPAVTYVRGIAIQQHGERKVALGSMTGMPSVKCAESSLKTGTVRNWMPSATRSIRGIPTSGVDGIDKYMKIFRLEKSEG